MDRWGQAVRALMIAVISALVMVPAAFAATPANPVLAGPPASNSGSLSGAVSVAVSGNYAYSPSYYSGVLTAVDFSNPAAPVVAGQSPASNALLNASTINIAGGVAYVASKNANGPCLPGPSPMCAAGTNDNGSGNSLSLYNVSTNPAVPTYIGSVTDATKLFGAYGVAVSGNYAYVAAQGCLGAPQPCPDPTVGNRFDVVDLSIPAMPTIVASLTNPASGSHAGALSHATSVAIHSIGGHMYAFVTAFNSSRLTIIDITIPTSPSIVSSITNSAFNLPADVVVGPTVQNSTYAYVASQSAGGPIAVVDVSTPSSPQVVGSVSSASLGGAYRIRLRGNFAYVSGSSVAAVSAVDISDPAHPFVAGSLTDTAHLNKTTGLDVDASGQYVVAASPFLSTEGNPTFPPYPPALGRTSTGTISTVKIDPVPIGVTIAPGSEPPNQTTLTSANFTFSVPDAVATVQCGLDAAPLASCPSSTTQSYASLAAGSHTFTVQATDAAGTTATDTYTWTVEQVPASAALPRISGLATQGQTLTASNGTWTAVPAPTFAYQWADCDAAGLHCSTISGATGSTDRLGAGDAGHTLRVLVTATNPAGSALATSGATSVVAPVHKPPVITGLRQAAKLWREAGKPAQTIPGKPKPKHVPTGTTFSLKLSARASVRLSFTLKTPGRKANGRCRTQTAPNRHQARCTLTRAAGTLVVKGRKGANKVSFTGRVAHGKKLGPGSYTVALTAAADGERSKRKTISFTIVG